jgi:hypothetical protein
MHTSIEAITVNDIILQSMHSMIAKRSFGHRLLAALLAQRVPLRYGAISGAKIPIQRRVILGSGRLRMP